jgi:serine beta-lactamase-like protein LACTB, mitochondrial
MKRIVLTLWLAAGAHVALAACPPATCFVAREARTHSAAADAAASAIQEKYKLPSISIAVAVDGKLRWSHASGDVDLESHVPASRTTKYRIGSVSKLITAAAVMRLADAGKIDLDTPIQAYVPSFPVKPSPITLRLLLGHLAGIRHYGPTDRMHERGFFVTRHYASTTDALEIFSSDALLSEPGTKYFYSSYGFNLAGAAVEGASGQSFFPAVRSLVLVPGGIDAVDVDDIEAIVDQRARGYRRDKDGALANSNNVDSCYKLPSGGLLATPEALVRFASLHLAPGFLSAKALSQMFTSQTTTEGEATGIGLGWRIAKQKDGRVVYHHGGLIEGGRAFVLLDPERKIAVAIATNIESNFGLDEALAFDDLIAK